MKNLLGKISLGFRTYIHLRKIPDTSTWEEYYFFHKVPLIDGTMASGWLMTRVIGGKRENRTLTDDEESDLESRLVW